MSFGHGANALSPATQDAPGAAAVQRRARGDASGAAGSIADRAARRGSDLHAQAKTADGGGAAAVHEAAARGKRGGGGPMPHLAAIQRSFGGHDVSGINAHVGGEAATASREMGASAYAHGDDVAFAQAPDLHTAAHEAAHVVQQKGGVSVAGGVGQAGDGYEQAADRVADRVVRGESAEDLLGAPRGGGGGAGVVQKKGGNGLVSWEVVQGVFDRKLREKAAELKLPDNDPKVMDAAMAATRTQVGPGNYTMWENRGSATVGPITTVQPKPPAADEDEDDIDMSPGATYARMKAKVGEMDTQASKLGQEVVALEAKCQRLASPEGITGFMYEAGMGTMGLAYGGVSRGAGLVVDAMNPFTYAATAKTLATGGDFSDTAVGGMVDTAKDIPASTGTSIDLMRGKLADLYKQTRPAHDAFEAASGRFSDARGRFFASTDVYGKALDAMRDLTSALSEMSAAAKTYSTLCADLGIPGQAMRMDKLDKAVVEGGGTAVDVASGFLAGGVLNETPSGPAFLKKKGDKELQAGLNEALGAGAKDAHKAVTNYAQTGIEKAAENAAGTAGDATALIK